MSEVTSLITGFLAATVRISTPLLYAATGELLVERSGVINLGVEGAMLAGALAAALGASTGGPWIGLLTAIAAGVLVTAVFVAVAIGARADQIITGTAVTLGAIGLTGAVYRSAYGAGGPGLSIPTFDEMPIPGLRSIPVLGPALFDQPLLTYIAWLLVPLTGWFLYRSWWGLALRATGESAGAAHASGVPVRRVRIVAALVAGGLAGAGGATLVLAQVGTFAEEMTAGRGFLAIAIVVLGRWRPGGVLLAALLFAGANALQFVFQAMGLGVPYQLFLMLPYLLALAALALGTRAWGAPAGLGKR
ncbi:MAG: ABC transporter permease [Gemmatimonadales bacterium]